MITLFAKLLKILNSDDSPSQIALAIVLAFMMGLTPLASPHNLLLLLIVLIVRINVSMFLISFGLFTLIAYAFDPLSHQLGLWLLELPSLQTLWTHLYQSSFWRLLGFNNSLILGSLSLSLLLSPLLFIGSHIIISHYRQRLMQWAEKTRLMIWLKSGNLFNAYQRLQE